MQISQHITIVILTALLLIFIGIVVQNKISDKMNQAIIFGVVISYWILFIIFFDIYSNVNELRVDILSYMKK